MSADKALAAAKTDEAKERAEERRQKAASGVEEAGKQLDTATADAKSKPDAAAAKNAVKAAEAKKAATAKAATRCEARARAGLDLHQPRHAEALRAAQHA